MNQCFLGLEKRMDLDAAHTEKNFAHVNQRFDNLKEVVNDLRLDMREDMRQMRNWLFRLYGLIVFGFIGTAVLILFRELIFK